MQNRDTQQKTADSSGSRRKAEPSTLALYLDASAVRGANPAGNRQPRRPPGRLATGLHRRASSGRSRCGGSSSAIPMPFGDRDHKRRCRGGLLRPAAWRSGLSIRVSNARRRFCPLAQNRGWRAGPLTANLTPRRRAAPCSGAAASRTISSLSGDSPGSCSESPPAWRLFTTGEVLSASSRISSRPAAPSARRPRP